MNLSALFIYRPVATSLLTLAISLAGILAFLNLPVASLPQVEFPTISVTAQLPGASAETMAATVATPLERALGRIAGIAEMTSSSLQGASQITLQFDLDRDINGAARDVQAAINAAAGMLPSGMPNRPSYRLDNPSDAPILVLALTSDTLGRGQMYDAASTILAQKISQIPGIGLVQLGGAALPAVRVELNPNALSKYGIGLEDVRNAITQTNVNRPKGVLENGGQRWQIQANDQARKAADYLPLIVSYRNGAPVTIADLGEAVDSVEDLRNTGLKNGKPSVLLILRKQPQANVIETVDQVLAILPQLRASIPSAIDLSVVIDRSMSIRSSITEVEHSLLIAMALVILVVLLFLRDIRSTLVPIIAVPASLFGACAAMYFFNYSLNNLTLMALTIATGFVVDDAIVVLENTSRHIEKGVPPFKAALLATKEVSFTVLAMSVSLVAVFLPILLMDGVVGRLFREFAVTLSAAVLVSLVVSLTVTPMLCARWVGKENPQHGRLYQSIGRAFDRVQHFYGCTLRWALRHGRIMMLILLATIGLNIYLYTVIDKGFFPTQDGGRVHGEIQADQGTSFWALQKKFFEVTELLRQDSAVSAVVGFAGSQQSGNSARVFVVLKPHDERGPVDEVMKRLRDRVKRVPGVDLHMFVAQELRIGGRPSFGSYDYALQSDDLGLLREWMPKVLAALSKLPELSDVSTTQQDKGQQIGLVVDRDMAARYGVSQAMIDASLNDAFGQRQVSVIYNPLNQYRVVMELAPEYWQSPEALKQVYISVPAKRLPTGEQPGSLQVPLSALASFAPTNTPLSVNHQGQFAAATLSFNLRPGTSLSTATELIEKTMRDIGVPNGVQGSFQGSAKAFKESLRNQPLLILAALVSIYIVLGVLYESYIHPLTILSTLPSAGVGALLALMACNNEFSIIALIGVILLIGIVKKNAIMMIDFALFAERELGLDSREAIFQACLLRFRPIMMTTMAALFGALPLALGSGYGAELRQPLGISIVGGLIFSQILTLYTTPVVYLYLDRFRLWFHRRFFNRAASEANKPV
ncbi:MAG: efflux RND transporter permease subunit [Methylobacter tundripaludum]|uniref:Multidrug efflux pump n=1 Tax=Methylobacter tundripaludum TaxID=173365 RepID=A0A2S6GU24_9GAMM|nr:efflux RND transporter permease subunit [Methylobacter tundripaludum]MCF7966050.1 efflux RND transporter permease subunit [Methylobacter tundripaludum]PPK68710.1 multidrug efflux pump [Methylobacter tundripaludum]